MRLAIFLLLLTQIYASNCKIETYRFSLEENMPVVHSHIDELSVDFSKPSRLLSAARGRLLASPITAIKGSWGVRYVWRLEKNTVFFIKKDIKKNQISVIFSPSDCQVLRKKTIVIDPGHGGKDPGAHSYKGYYEKNITLQYAKALQSYLRQHGDYDVHLTRTDDSFVSLRKRLEIAESHQADLLLSIHADAFESKSIHGASVYAFAPEGASSQQAKSLLDVTSEPPELLEASLTHQKNLLGFLYEIRQRQTLVKSIHACQGFRKSLQKNEQPLHGKHVEQAGFVVLSSASVPSVLVELGYLSSALDADRLRSKNGKKQMIKALGDAMIAYFSSHTDTTPTKEHKP